MSKGTTIKDAIAKFEDKEACKASETEKITLICQIPPVEKMDASLSTLAHCTQLSLSTNMIEKIANLNGLKNLKILSLGRNNIKSLTGLEAVGDTLEELWISYNKIEKLKGINVLKKLKILYLANNDVKDKNEFEKLHDLPCLAELLFCGNPLEVEIGSDDYRPYVAKKLPKLKKLDGCPIVEHAADQDQQQQQMD